MGVVSPLKFLKLEDVCKTKQKKARKNSYTTYVFVYLFD